LGRGGDRSCADAVIAAEHDRHRALVERSETGLVHLLADLRDVADVFLVLVALFLRLGDRRRQIAFVTAGVAERADALSDARNAERRRPHVDAAPSAAEIERHADDVDGLHLILTDTDMPSLDGITIVVKSRGSFLIASRKSRISVCLFTTLCATKSPLAASRGSIRSRKRL